MWQDVRTLNAITNALLGLLLLVLLAAGVWWLTQRPMFALKAIQIEGTTEVPLRHVSASTIRSTALPRVQGNFFSANLDTVRSAFESVPWVRSARVRREWPDKLIVTIEEHRPLGTWGEDGALLSVKGDLFTANLAEAEEYGELLEFDGPVGSEKEVAASFQNLSQWFAPARLVPNAVRLSGRYAWTVRMSNGMTVELGREQSTATLKQRVERLVNIYPQLLSRLQNGIDSIDMRYPNGLALRASGMTFGAEITKK